MTLPNFLIVGAAKCGTTSLFAYLEQHPDVYMPPIKEPAYFSDGMPTVVRSDAEYEALFDGRRHEKAVGEASTPYLYDEKAAQRIFRLLGHIKIIIMLRNPVSRAYSLWGQNTYEYACEDLPFEEALNRENDRMASRAFFQQCRFFYGNYHYFHSGLYFEQVGRYMDTFGRNNVQVHIFEEFVRDPAAICRRVFSFLEIDPDFLPVLDRHNVAATYKIGPIHRFLLCPPLFLSNLLQALPTRLKLAAYSMGRTLYGLNRETRPRQPLDEKLRLKLMDKYRDDIGKLEQLLGRDLSIWYTDNFIPA